MPRFSELMSTQPVLPIIQANSPEEGVHIAQAMAAAGLTLVEVVLRTASSLDALRAIKESVPGLLAGAGTVLNDKTLHSALDAGADFIVTPAVSPRLLAALTESPVPALPGVANTGDILMAQEFGFREQKLFPAALSGGAPFLAAVGAVFDDVVFCPTGGINPENKQAYLSLENVFAVGGTWVAKQNWVANRNWQAITDACAQAIR